MTKPGHLFQNFVDFLKDWHGNMRAFLRLCWFYWKIKLFELCLQWFLSVWVLQGMANQAGHVHIDTILLIHPVWALQGMENQVGCVHIGTILPKGLAQAKYELCPFLIPIYCSVQIWWYRHNTIIMFLPSIGKLCLNRSATMSLGIVI